MPQWRVTTWTEAPELAIPYVPALLSDSSDLWLAYETRDEPLGQVFAIVRFRRVVDHRLSPINDEGIAEHPYGRAGLAGLRLYAFNEVIDSAEAVRWRALRMRYWVVSFKDNTLDVLAENAEVAVPSVRGSDPVSVLVRELASRR